jgi:hypothetical protein
MFRFSIRDLLWLTALVAMGCGWWMERRQGNEGRLLIKELEAGKLRAETGWQTTTVERNKMLRATLESGHTLVEHDDGTTTLERSWPRPESEWTVGPRGGGGMAPQGQ